MLDNSTQPKLAANLKETAIKTILHTAQEANQKVTVNNKYYGSVESLNGQSYAVLRESNNLQHYIFYDRVEAITVVRPVEYRNPQFDPDIGLTA